MHESNLQTEKPIGSWKGRIRYGRQEPETHVKEETDKGERKEKTHLRIIEKKTEYKRRRHCK